MTNICPTRMRKQWGAMARCGAMLIAALWSHGAAADALTEINSVLNDFKAMINSHTAAGDLDYTHIFPYLDANFLDEGTNRTGVAADLAEELRGGSISSVSVTSVLGLTTDGMGNSIATTSGSLNATTQDGPLNLSWNDQVSKDVPPLSRYLKPVGGAWKLYGDQASARLQVNTFTENRQGGSNCGSGCDGTYYFVWFDALAPKDLYSSVSVNGPGYNAASLAITGDQQKQKQASPPPAAKMNFNYNEFVNDGPAVTDLPPVGSAYTFTLTPSSGAPQTKVVKTSQWTKETISITSPTGHSLSDANLGKSLAIQWGLPTSFTVSSLNTYLVTNSAAGTCNTSFSNNNLPANTTSYTIDPMPTQCLGQPIADGVSQGYPVQIVVEAIGTQGEVTRAWYALGATACAISSPPANLTASSVSASQVHLQWQKACMPTTIANYTLYRSTVQSGPFSKIGTTDLNTLSFTDNTVTHGTTYYYYAVATDTAIDISPQSNQINVTTPAGDLSISAGWNLVGNSNGAELDVAATFGDTSKVMTVWKWVPAASKWAFYAPSMNGLDLAASAARQGYDVLTTINAGEGFWVNSKTAFSLALPAGTPVTSSSFASTLRSGWSLISIGDNETPRDFNNSLNGMPPSPGNAAASGFATLWAWDNAFSKWYFYSPALDAQGGTALSDYISSKDYLNFATANKTLGPGVGFWVNKP